MSEDGGYVGIATYLESKMVFCVSIFEIQFPNNMSKQAHGNTTIKLGQVIYKSNNYIARLCMKH